MIEEAKFERTVWANMQLAKLCPNQNIKQLGDILGGDDTFNQLDKMIDVILIMNKAYVRKYKRLNPEEEHYTIRREELEDLSDQELIKLVNTAFGDFKADGETTVEIEEKKENAEVDQTESI